MQRCPRLDIVCVQGLFPKMNRRQCILSAAVPFYEPAIAIRQRRFIKGLIYSESTMPVPGFMEDMPLPDPVNAIPSTISRPC